MMIDYLIEGFGFLINIKFLEIKHGILYLSVGASEEEKSEFRGIALALLSHSDFVRVKGPDIYRDEPPRLSTPDPILIAIGTGATSLLCI